MILKLYVEPGINPGEDAGDTTREKKNSQ